MHGTEVESNVDFSIINSIPSNETNKAISNCSTTLSRKRSKGNGKWKKFNNMRFTYVDLDNPLYVTGEMDTEYIYCRALKWDGESPGVSCRNSNSTIQDLFIPLEPLRTYLFKNGRDSSFF